MANKTKDTDFTYKPAAKRRQSQIFFDPHSYSAFPHVIQLEGDELLLAFRQAPKQDVVRHTHPRSLITLIRSYDNGQSWDIENAAQMGAGGGQELGLIYFGKGKVGGALSFDGTNDYVQTSLVLNTLPYTIMADFKSDVSSGERSIVDTDVSGKYGNSIILGYWNGDNTIDVEYSSDVPIAGYQFKVEGVDLLDATGNNLTVTSGNNIVITIKYA